MGVTRTEREWLELVATLFAEPLVDMPVDRIGPMLMTTFETAGVTFSEVEPESLRHRWWDGGLGALAPDLAQWSVHRADREHPLLRFYLATGLWTPRQVADVPDTFQDRWTADGGRALANDCSAAQQLALPLRATAAMSRSFVLGRQDPWGPGELAFAERLWRLLSGLEKQVSALAAVTGGQGVSAAEIPLTPREQAVLGLLAQGLTAGTIARRLGISPRTVQKHLERCYLKLGVTDRLSAVLRAQALGLV
ncbi:helix-turn-helix transcriptional regulator [Pseudonocardia pini]|uniref:helix-turn-helix transcriptional regulator n=1 Tax=Pseudonocardia pini TaxID=2758030 RepID=UPI0015F12006|nr:LuxR C-terminal-related transcriptional regulator [Pseudonocardia pini]